MKRILIEGWRGICQSLAMVNQYQILELNKAPGLTLCHTDLPYYFPHWANPGNEAGFPREMERSILAIPKADEGQFDTIYRIGFPITRSNARSQRILTFIVTELGISSEQFAPGDSAVDRFCSGADMVVTPSNWSRAKLLEHGFPEERVSLVPHGVNSDIFFPLSKQERQSIRQDLGLGDGHLALLNLGGLSPNKGVNHLLTAFKHVRQRHENARLILKDSGGLYGTTVQKYLEQYIKANGPMAIDVLNSIIIVPSSLSLDEMRQLYGAADVYVSPYRAEGFNLPVIESIACGTPVIVTGGGATDDFCDASTSLKIASRRVANKDRASPIPGDHLEPNLDSLIALLEQATAGRATVWPRFEDGRKQILDKFSWNAVTRQLVDLF